MKHPDPADWIPYLYGEDSLETHARLEAHLNACPACQAQLNQWQATTRTLNRWQIPTPTRTAFVGGPLFGLLRWAIVVAVAALAGAVAGRWSTPPTPSHALVATAPPPPSAPSSPAPAVAELVATQKAILSAIEHMQDENDTRFLGLRRDLETLAKTTDAAIRQARRGLYQLAVQQTSPEIP